MLVPAVVPEVVWGGELVKGSSINKASGSFMAGFGIVSSESKEAYNLMDVNSDGLPDKVWKEGNGIKVSFNIGNAFLSPINWKGASALSESASTSESVKCCIYHQHQPASSSHQDFH